MLGESEDDDEVIVEIDAYTDNNSVDDEDIDDDNDDDDDSAYTFIFYTFICLWFLDGNGWPFIRLQQNASDDDTSPTGLFNDRW